MYDPKIYIRDYPDATVTALLRSGAYVVTGYPITVLRHLIAQVQAPDEQLLLLEGDMQSGTDILLLEGDESGGLALDEYPSAQFHVTGYPITVSFGVTRASMTTGVFTVTGNAISVDYSGELTLEGDMQSGADTLLLEGDMQSDVDTLITNIVSL